MSPQGLCRMLSPGTQGVWANECISYEKNKTKKLFASNILSGAYFVPGIVTRASKKKKIRKGLNPITPTHQPFMPDYLGTF